MGSSGLPKLRGTIGASVALNLYVLRDLCNVIVAVRDNNLLFKGLIIYLRSTARWLGHYIHCGCLLRCRPSLA